MLQPFIVLFRYRVPTSRVGLEPSTNWSGLAHIPIHPPAGNKLQSAQSPSLSAVTDTRAPRSSPLPPAGRARQSGASPLRDKRSIAVRLSPRGSAPWVSAPSGDGENSRHHFRFRPSRVVPQACRIRFRTASALLEDVEARMQVQPMRFDPHLARHLDRAAATNHWIGEHARMQNLEDLAINVARAVTAIAGVAPRSPVRKGKDAAARRHVSRIRHPPPPVTSKTSPISPPR